MDENRNRKPDKAYAAAGLLFFVVGIIMIFQGYDAYQAGAIIPATGKHGPMTGTEYMIGGGMFSIFGLGFLLNELLKAKRK